jgi:hypothetical protein
VTRANGWWGALCVKFYLSHGNGEWVPPKPEGWSVVGEGGGGGRGTVPGEVDILLPSQRRCVPRDSPRRVGGSPQLVVQ